MAEIKVGQKYTRVGVWSVQKDHETYCVVTGVSGDRVKYTYDSGRSDYSSVESFYPSFQDYGDSYQGAAFVLVEVVEELEPLKLEHLKAGQLVIRKRDDWQRFITKVNGDEIEYLCGYKGEHLTIKMDSQASDFLEYFRLPDISEVAQLKKDNPETFAEYTVSAPSYKVGDYLAEEAGDIVWKVTEVGEDDSLLTEALLIQDADDVVDTYRLGSVTLSTMVKATPEQVAAFENHPYWGKQEPVADAISPSVYQFPNGVEVRDISAHLTSFGGQAVQYIARATRLDGVVKGLPVQDLKKAIQLLEWEVERLES